MEKFIVSITIAMTLLVFWIFYVIYDSEKQCLEWSYCQLERDCILVAKNRWQFNYWVWYVWWQVWTISSVSKSTKTFNCNWVMITK